MIRGSIIVFLVLFSLLSKGDSWVRRADFGGSGRFGAVGFSIATKGYIGLGQNHLGVMYSDFWEYDEATDAWTQIANFPGIQRVQAVGFSIGEMGYVGTGYNYNNANYLYLNDFWEFNSALNSWSQKADVGSIGRSGAIGFSIADKGYIGTGASRSNYLNDFWEYDQSINIWTLKMQFGGTNRVMSIGFSDGSKGYLGLGADLPTYPYGKYDFWEWDPITNVWIQLADFQGTGRTEATAFWICPYGYVGLGTTNIGFGTVSDFWKYEISSNTWSRAANFGPGGREVTVSFSIGVKGYVGTGKITDNGAGQKDFWEYVPDRECATDISYSDDHDNQLHFYPNPTHDWITTNYSFKKNVKLEVKIIDVQGKKVHVHWNNNYGIVKIDLRNISRGVYFIELTSEEYYIVRKIFKY